MLAEQSGLHRAVLTLRYLDGLPVGEVAHVLGRTRRGHRGAARPRPRRVPPELRGEDPMTHPHPDPFRALRAADGPVDPDPAFAATLRARLERALLCWRNP